MKAESYIRLLPTDDWAWALFPVFRSRIEAFIQKYLPATDPAPVVYDVVTKWTSLPKTTGYWLVFQGNKPVAHLASWILDSYGKPFIFVYQAECDEGYSLSGVQASIMYQMDQWVAEINAVIPPDRPKIVKGEMTTWRNAEVFAHYLSRTGREAAKVRSVIEFGVGPVTGV